MKLHFCIATGLAVLAVHLIAHSAHAQSLLYKLRSPNEYQFGSFGVSVSGVPDVDGDGRGDVVVGAYGEARFYGRAHVFSGATGELIYSVRGRVANIELGKTVAGTPDLDGDGRGDLLLSEDFQRGRSAVEVVSGATGRSLYTLFSPTMGYNFFGGTLAGAGDLDGDGASEILIGAQLEDFSQATEVGRVYVVSGASGTSLFALSSPNRMQGGHFGSGLAAVPDTDGDGINDILVGASGETFNKTGAGRAYLFSGATGDLLLELGSPAPKRAGSFGEDVAGLADVDGDGRGDLAVGAPQEDNLAQPNAGSVYIFSGATGALLQTLHSPNAQAQGLFGNNVSRLHDVDADGADDLVVSAPFEFAQAGRAYVFSGGTGELLYALVSPHEESSGFFGSAVSGVDDADGDGRGDLIIGADYEGGDGTPGRAYVFSGGSDL